MESLLSCSASLLSLELTITPHHPSMKVRSGDRKGSAQREGNVEGKWLLDFCLKGLQPLNTLRFFLIVQASSGQTLPEVTSYRPPKV